MSDRLNLGRVAHKARACQSLATPNSSRETINRVGKLKVNNFLHRFLQPVSNYRNWGAGIMGRLWNGAGALGVMFFASTHAVAETVPPLLANFPVTQDDVVQRAYAEQIRSSFPRDIRTSTLTALLEMDGFTVFSTGVGHAATFVKADFPCITDYMLTWDENETGRVTDLDVSMNRKCV